MEGDTRVRARERRQMNPFNKATQPEEHEKWRKERRAENERRGRVNRARESGNKRASGGARKRSRENQGGGDGDDELGDGVAVDPQTEGAGEVGLFQRVARGIGLGGGGRPT